MRPQGALAVPAPLGFRSIQAAGEATARCVAAGEGMEFPKEANAGGGGPRDGPRLPVAGCTREGVRGQACLPRRTHRAHLPKEANAAAEAPRGRGSAAPGAARRSAGCVHRRWRIARQRSGAGISPVPKRAYLWFQ
jgi:hypothetical protein